MKKKTISSRLVTWVVLGTSVLMLLLLGNVPKVGAVSPPNGLPSTSSQLGTLLIQALGSTADILSFGFPSLSVSGVISGNTIEVVVPHGTDVTKLAPEIIVSDSASVFPQ